MTNDIAPPKYHWWVSGERIMLIWDKSDLSGRTEKKGKRAKPVKEPKRDPSHTTLDDIELEGVLSEEEPLPPSFNVDYSAFDLELTDDRPFNWSQTSQTTWR